MHATWMSPVSPLGEVTPYERIVDAATRLVRHAERLSVRRVAREAKLSPGTVTYYFRSIDQLLDALGSEYFDRGQRGLVGMHARASEEEIIARVKEGVHRAFVHRSFLQATMTVTCPRKERVLEEVLTWAVSAGGEKSSAGERKILTMLFVRGVGQLVSSRDEDLMRWSNTQSIEDAREAIASALGKAVATLLQRF